jgi:hypothetical protein
VDLAELLDAGPGSEEIPAFAVGGDGPDSEPTRVAFADSSSEAGATDELDDLFVELIED